MFENQNHLYALATVIGTMGGFQQQPEWFKSISTTSIWQILMSTVLVYQGGGNLDFTYSLVISILFYIAVHLSNYIKINSISNVKSIPQESAPAPAPAPAPSAEATEQEAETFLGYY